MTKVVLSGLVGTSYPEDIAGQRAIFTPLIAPIVVLILGPDVPFDLLPRRGVVRNSVLPPCEVDLRSPGLAQKFRTEGARLSRAKQHDLGKIYFNPCIKPCEPGNKQFIGELLSYFVLKNSSKFM